MTHRISTSPGIPKAYKALIAMSGEVTQAGTDAGVEKKLLELVKIRASQINGCAFCIDMHTTAFNRIGVSSRLRLPPAGVVTAAVFRLFDEYLLLPGHT